MSEQQASRAVDHRFLLRRSLASGGPLERYDAVDLLTQRSVQVQWITALLRSDEGWRRRLQRMGRALGRARGEATEQLVAAGECERFGLYVVTEHTTGRRLDDVLGVRTLLSPSEVARLMLPVARSLARLHERGVVHRGVSLSNLVYTRGRDGQPRLVLSNFEQALLLEEPSERGDSSATAALVSGGVEHLPPERLLAPSAAVGSFTDAFGFGVALFEALTHRLPFGRGLRVYLRALRAGYPALPLASLRPDASAELAALVEELLRVDPATRPSDLAMVAARLEAATAPVERVPERIVDLPAAAPGSSAAPNADARLPYLAAARVRAGSLLVDGRTEDLSASGVRVALHAELPVGAEVQLRFALPIHGQQCSVHAVVRWCRREGAGARAGLAFVAPPRALVESLRAYAELSRQRDDAGTPGTEDPRARELARARARLLASTGR